jgi:hypothetical protein
MGYFSYELKDGYFVLLETLNQHLSEMSNDVHQWAAVAIPGIFPCDEGRPRSFVLIGYSTADPAWLLNPLCFVAPLVALGGENTDYSSLLVSCRPGAMRPLTRGLYLEGDEVKYDFLEDWVRVWTPIKQKVWPQLSDCKTSTISHLGRARDPAARSCHFDYRIKFISYLHRMASSREAVSAIVD